MSSLARWSYKEGPVTVWPYSVDQNGQAAYGTPYLIPETDQAIGGDVMRDDDGSEFTPRISVYFEAAEDSLLIPVRNWFMKPGDHSALAKPPSDAERIRTVMHWPMAKFGAGQLPDWKVTA